MNRRLWLAGLVPAVRLLGLQAPTALTAINEQTLPQILGQHRGKVLLVDFWATWCSPCREEMPKLAALRAAFQSKGLDMINISCDEPEQESEALSFVKKQDLPAPFYVKHTQNNDRFINSMDTKWSGALPALFLYDRSGHQAKSFIGETDMKALEAAVKALLAT